MNNNRTFDVILDRIELGIVKISDIFGLSGGHFGNFLPAISPWK